MKHIHLFTHKLIEAFGDALALVMSHVVLHFFFLLFSFILKLEGGHPPPPLSQNSITQTKRGLRSYEANVREQGGLKAYWADLHICVFLDFKRLDWSSCCPFFSLILWATTSSCSLSLSLSLAFFPHLFFYLFIFIF